MVKNVKHINWLPFTLIIIGIILVIDQLYLFGIPFGPILPNLSRYDPTGSPAIHHWMLGVGLIVLAIIMMKPKRSRC